MAKNGTIWAVWTVEDSDLRFYVVPVQSVLENNAVLFRELYRDHASWSQTPKYNIGFWKDFSLAYVVAAAYQVVITAHSWPERWVLQRR
jgi:hypothetical protein